MSAFNFTVPCQNITESIEGFCETLKERADDDIGGFETACYIFTGVGAAVTATFFGYHVVRHLCLKKKKPESGIEMIQTGHRVKEQWDERNCRASHLFLVGLGGLATGFSGFIGGASTYVHHTLENANCTLVAETAEEHCATGAETLVGYLLSSFGHG